MIPDYKLLWPVGGGRLSREEGSRWHGSGAYISGLSWLRWLGAAVQISRPVRVRSNIDFPAHLGTLAAVVDFPVQPCTLAAAVQTSQSNRVRRRQYRLPSTVGYAGSSSSDFSVHSGTVAAAVQTSRSSKACWRRHAWADTAGGFWSRSL